MRTTTKFSQVTRPEKTPQTATGAVVLSLVKAPTVALISKEEKEGHTPEQISPEESSDEAGNHIADIASLSRMQLRKRYGAEANAHRNMLQRAKSKGAVIHPDFKEFPSFLRLVGPVPAKGATLDRIMNTDPEYAPGKVRWADKHTQNGNKGDTRTFYNSATGTTFTTSILAKLHGVTTSTIRKRYERGWSDEEIIAGKRGVALVASQTKTASQPVSKLPPPTRGILFPVGLYDPLTEANLNRVRSCLKDNAQRKFYDAAHDAQEHRNAYGAECMLATYEEQLDIDPIFQSVTRQQHKAHFLRWWATYRYHIHYPSLTPDQKRMVEDFDPEWVTARWGNYGS